MVERKTEMEKQKKPKMEAPKGVPRDISLEMSTRGKTEIAGAECNDRNCHIHGNLKVRGRTFEGTVTKKFHKRIVIEFERMVRVRKYERYKRLKTKIHARLPVCMENEINVGDYIKIQECRPLSKLIHFVVIEKIRGGEKQ